MTKEFWKEVARAFVIGLIVTVVLGTLIILIGNATAEGMVG